jgi:hypothetical protein
MNSLKLLTKIFSALLIILFIFKPGPILAACVECENDHPGICNLYSPSPQFNAMVGRYCGASTCTFFDACAPHTQNNASCDGSNYNDLSARLIRLSVGESWRGSFVGCNASNQSENCFCNGGASVGGSVSGTVQCYDDSGDDSCAARQTSCTPDCSCASSTCVGYDCANGCGWWCDGALQPNCNCAANTCVGQTCDGTCEAKCNGTKQASCSYSSWQNITNPTCGGNTQYRTGTATCGANCPTEYRGCNECQTCAKACGQTKNCGGSCAATLCGDPSVPTNIFPNNTQSNKYITLNSPITLTWSDPATPKGFDGFSIYVHDTTTTWNAGSCSTSNNSSFCQSVSSSVHSLNFPASGNMMADHLYHWWIYATKSINCAGLGTCSGDDGLSTYAEGYFLYDPNLPPTFSNLTIKNSSGTLVSVETGNKNQICQTAFNKDRIVTFTVTASDPDGVSDITDIKLRWNGHEFTRASLNNGVAVFTETLNSNLNNGITYPLQVNVTDTRNNTTGWIGSGRNFKIWDCGVSLQGTVYDGSSEELGPSCNASSFNKPINANISYSLKYDSGDSEKTMTVVSPNYSSDSSNNLFWGDSYRAEFTIPASVSQMKTTDLGDQKVASVCPNSLLNLVLDDSHVNPYSTEPKLQVDFSTIVDQENWYQSTGGSINSLTTVSDFIPVTCTDTTNCQNSISIKNPITSSDNGVIISLNLDKGCDSCTTGNPNNWYISQNRSNLGESYDYQYFYNIYSNNPSGITHYNDSKNWSSIVSDIGGTGIILINGSVTIDNNISLNSGEMLMIIANGQIIINSAVNHVEGILVANQGIVASGNSDDQLIIDGILYSPNSSVLLDRTFKEKSDNNSAPSVLINYQPEFLFNLPLQIVEILSIHQYGI